VDTKVEVDELEEDALDLSAHGLQVRMTTARLEGELLIDELFEVGIHWFSLMLDFEVID